MTNSIDFLGKGWKFPIRVNGRGGLSFVTGEQSIVEAIWIILATPPNSRIMEPEFGCGIHDYVFAPNTPNTRAMITQAVQRALLRWEPRIDVLNVTATSQPEMPNLLEIHMDYRVRANNAYHNLVYPFYVNEGKG
jgi:phage baseplate assembly protein W